MSVQALGMSDVAEFIDAREPNPKETRALQEAP
jgi:hypothetical protein